MPTQGSIVVVSGGSAANSLVDVFKGTSAGSPISYIIGISDNGGSTSELIRVFGGPGIGDIRSRLIRLVPEDTEDEERLLVKKLLNYRLPSSAEEARIEWNSIVEGTHEKWRGIASEKKELLRSFFIYVAAEITKRTRPSSTFNFQHASLGNLFLTSCRLFFGSLESAIFLFRSICSIPEYIHVIPALNSNFSHHIAAGLENGDIIAGQNQISHPSEEVPTNSQNAKMTDITNRFLTATSLAVSHGITGSTTPLNPGYSTPILYPHQQTPPPFSLQPQQHHSDDDEVEDANLPGSLPALRRGNIVFTKEEEAELPARIQRLWYINPYGQEIRPPANPKSLATIRDAETLVYSIGSLYTSIIPCLVLRGMGEAIANSCKQKVLVLNGSYDREIGPGKDFTAFDFVKAIVNACVESRGIITSTAVQEINEAGLQEVKRLSAESEWHKYVTHVLYVEGEGVPKVQTARLKELDIECWKVAGRRNEKGKGMVYDLPSLIQALNMIRGKRRSSKGRRSTVEFDTTRVGIVLNEA